MSNQYFGFQSPLAKKYLSRDGYEISLSTTSRIQREIHRSQTITEERLRTYALRQRRPRFGELIQPQDSPRACLLAFIDDATGIITAARFYPTENMTGYLALIKEHISRYGVPVALYSDRHTIFTRKLPESPLIEPPYMHGFVSV